LKNICNFFTLGGGINTGKLSSSAEYGTRDVFATFEGHLQKVLAWKENPHEFIQELVDQDTRDTLHCVIKEKLKMIVEKQGQ
jgi:DNA helicase II / ATP-dependent DNA helicase PcrA